MKYPQMKTIYTEDFILREIRKNDYYDFFEFYSKDAVTKYLPFKAHKNLEDTKRFINMFFIKNYERGRISHYAIVDRKTHRVIGNIGFNNISINSQNAEIGVCINPYYWGNNLAVRLAKLIIKYGFENLNLKSIYAVIYSENIYSKNALEKLDFKYQKSFYKRDKLNKLIKCDKYVLFNNRFKANL